VTAPSPSELTSALAILLAAALTALVLLRREARVGRPAGVDRAVATSR
jgi:hypothetical protein